MQVGDLVKHRYRSPEMVGVVMKLSYVPNLLERPFNGVCATKERGGD